MKKTTVIIFCFFVCQFSGIAQSSSTWDQTLLIAPDTKGSKKIGYSKNSPLTFKFSRTDLQVILEDGKQLIKADIISNEEFEQIAETTAYTSLNKHKNHTVFLKYACKTNGPGEIILQVDGEVLFLNLKKGWRCTNHSPMAHTCDKLPQNGVCGNENCIWTSQE